MKSVAWIFLLAGFVVACGAEKVYQYSDPINKEGCTGIWIKKINNSLPRCPIGCTLFSRSSFSVCLRNGFARTYAVWLRISVDNDGSDGEACRIQGFACKPI